MKKIYKVGVIALIALMLTGCGNSNYILNDEKKPVENKETGQVLQKDILCKPESDSLKELYEKYSDQTKIKYDELPSCKDYSIGSNKSSGLWEGLFVKPLAWLILKLGYLIKSFGLAVIIIGLLIRMILMPVSRKTMKQSDNMKKAQPELQRIEKKYANRTDNEAMMAKSQEMMMVYKKYNISPIGSCLLSFIQLPLFFAFLQAVNRVPAIFEDTFLGLTLGKTPIVGLFQYKEWAYIIIIALIIFTTYYSFKHAMSGNATGNVEMQKQMQFMFKFMLVMISVASLYLSTAVALYWIATSGFAVVQTGIFKLMDKRDAKKDKIIKPKKEKKGKREGK